MNNNSLYINTLRIIAKSNNYCFGETLLYKLRFQKINLVVMATDMGHANQKKLCDKCQYYNIPYINLLTKDEMYHIFNKNISSFGILDANLTKKFLENLNKGGFSNGN